jgi:hypothetical protein
VVVATVQLFVVGSYRPPVFKSSKPSQPPQIIISLPVQIAVCDWRGAGAFVVLVAVHSLILGLYLPPVFNEI